MTIIHHSAVCVRNLEASLRFWRDGLGFDVLMDKQFEGDWPTLLSAPSTSLRSVFLGEPTARASGIVELVDLGTVPDQDQREETAASSGFLLLSVMTDVEAALTRLRELGLGGTPRRIEVSAVAMAVVTDPDGVFVELIDTAAGRNLDRLAHGGAET
jgi:catechol 2,3-dioxygenase-like lactoylglutathione lyase family enzyme